MFLIDDDSLPESETLFHFCCNTERFWKSKKKFKKRRKHEKGKKNPKQNNFTLLHQTLTPHLGAFSSLAPPLLWILQSVGVSSILCLVVRSWTTHMSWFCSEYLSCREWTWLENRILYKNITHGIYKCKGIYHTHLQRLPGWWGEGGLNFKIRIIRENFKNSSSQKNHLPRKAVNFTITIQNYNSIQQLG